MALFQTELLNTSTVLAAGRCQAAVQPYSRLLFRHSLNWQLWSSMGCYRNTDDKCSKGSGIVQTRKLPSFIVPESALLLTWLAVFAQKWPELANCHVSASRESFRAEADHSQPPAQGERTASLLFLYMLALLNSAPLYAVILNIHALSVVLLCLLEGKPISQMPFKNKAN